MFNLHWLLEGEGLIIIGTIAGIIVAAVTGFKVTMHQRINQDQKGGGTSEQEQIGSFTINSSEAKEPQAKPKTRAKRKTTTDRRRK